MAELRVAALEVGEPPLRAGVADHDLAVGGDRSQLCGGMDAVDELVAAAGVERLEELADSLLGRGQTIHAVQPIRAPGRRRNLRCPDAARTARRLGRDPPL
jgi:hypothetical protein